MRWTVKFSKAKARPDGTVPPVDIAIPTFGCQNHVSIDREHGLIRRWDATDAAAYEGARLREGLLDKTNTASAVWADTAYRSKANQAFLERDGSSAASIARSRSEAVTGPTPGNGHQPLGGLVGLDRLCDLFVAGSDRLVERVDWATSVRSASRTQSGPQSRHIRRSRRQPALQIIGMLRALRRDDADLGQMAAQKH